MCWSYIRDVSVCRELTERITADPYGFCHNLTAQQLYEDYEEDWNYSFLEEIVIKEVENEEARPV